MGMGFTPKNKESTTKITTNNNSSSESWGMGFLFIFFPEEEEREEKTPNFSFTNSSLSSSSSSYSFKTINAIRNRSNSSHLLSKAQSTISICLLFVFITLLFFTLSTFEPTNSLNQKQKPPNSSPFSYPNEKLILPPALQGMGLLYRRGTRAMNDLIVAHVIESVTEIDLKIFLRLLHRSGITSKSDIVVIFSSKTSSFNHAIIEENNSFSKLINGYYYYNEEEEKKNYNSSFDPNQVVNTGFDPAQFVISSKKEKESGEPIWGKKKIRGNEDFGNVTESTRLSYGSVVGFDVGELDPENSLSGFLEHVPMNLRRWACYPMLLGRVRRTYKHILLVDVKEHLVLGDSLSQLKNRSPESVILNTLPTRKKNSEKKTVNSGIVLGGTRGVRRLANEMLTEIVRAITQHKKRNSVSESTLFNQIVANEFLLKNVNLIVSGESTHELSSLTGLMNSNLKSGSSSFFISKFPIVRRGNSNLDISYVFKKYLCSSPLDSIAYSDC
ncbi:uncharacterized protein LOC129871364 [Solanum dulcamara]|uniref:uncharacterized protein LOC129871364 n=1 Tax=Solanum dulcamara TaxID=45834 RepID=UPI00248551D1|nr:uncharacterized protein LOC129871364 [Solanum dulcamara]